MIWNRFFLYTLEQVWLSPDPPAYIVCKRPFWGQTRVDVEESLPLFGKEMQVSFLKNPCLSFPNSGKGKEKQGSFLINSCPPIPSNGKSKERQGSLLIKPRHAFTCPFPSQTVGRARKGKDPYLFILAPSCPKQWEALLIKPCLAPSRPKQWEEQGKARILPMSHQL